MSDAGNLLWVLFQDLYEKYTHGEIDEEPFDYVRQKLFARDEASPEELPAADDSDL